MPKTDGTRVVADLKRLAEFGRYKTGVHRPTYSPVDVASRQWLADKFAEAGLEPVIDGIGNVFGHNPRATKRLLVGSHSETQPHGGWLDGALGVIYGARTGARLRRRPGAGRARHRAGRLGRRGRPLRQHARQPLIYRAAARCRDRQRHQPRRQDAARGAGRGRVRRPRRASSIDPARYVGYLEAHIEQGNTLETSGLRIGVVEAIIGNWNYGVTCTGEQNHAGTTQMRRRKDAGVAMVRLANRIHDRFAAIAGPRTVWTIGRMLLDPNAPSIVPGRAEMQVQFRDTDTGILRASRRPCSNWLRRADAAGPCHITIEPMSKSEPARDGRAISGV